MSRGRGRGRAHLGGEGEVRGAEPGGGPGARQWAAAGSAPRARAAVAPSRCLARGGERGGEEPRALQPPSGHEDGRGLRQDAAAVREPGPGRSGSRGGGGQRPAPQLQRPRAGARAAARAAAAAAEGPARTAAERAYAAEEAERRRGQGEWPGPAGPGRSWVTRTWSPRPPWGCWRGRQEAGEVAHWAPLCGTEQKRGPGQRGRGVLPSEHWFFFPALMHLT